MITVSRTNPPPWIVHCGENATKQTWPFQTQADAEAAYRLAVASGQFTHEMRTGATLTLVTLWRIEHTTTIKGEPHVHYVSVDVLETSEGKEQTNNTVSADT